MSSLENDLRSVKMELENIKDVLDAHPILKQEIMKLLSQNVTQNNTKILNWSAETRITNMTRQENRIENDFKDQRKLESDQEDLKNQEHHQEDLKNQEHHQETNQGDQETDMNIIQAERSNVERTRNLLEQADVIDEENLKIDELQPDK